MKNTKNLLRLATLLMAVFLLFSFTACDNANLPGEDTEVREMTENMLDAILANDAAAAYALFPSLTQAEFDSFFPGAHEYFKGVESYTLTMTGVHVNIRNGTKQYTAVYLMETNAQSYEITVSTVEGVKGFYGFHIISEKDSTVRFTGTLTTMKGANIAQWGLLVVGMATYAFVIWALVDCIRRKLRQKWAFILLILLGSVAILFTVQDTGINFNFNFFNLLSYTALMIYQNPAGALQLRIFIPLGAIFYLIFRKKWTLPENPSVYPVQPPIYNGTPYTPPQPPVPPVEETPKEETENQEEQETPTDEQEKM